MKWRKKFIPCVLLAGLMALMNSGCKEHSSVRLLFTKTLSFPAASGIEFYQDTLYVFGDNTLSLLLLTTDYQPLAQIDYGNSSGRIFSKEEKPDLESALLFRKDGKPVLVGVGSLSGESRWHTYEFVLGSRTLSRSQLFDSTTVFPQIKELNIEGSTAVGEVLVFCNRANLTNRQNHLLIRNGKETIHSKEVLLPKTNGVPGLSGLYYVAEKDILLFTASEEATANATDDGPIGESYIGWVNEFSAKLKMSSVKADGLLPLTSFHKAFSGQKIESLCLEKFSGNRFLLHLAADNDNGKSVLFKVELFL